MTKPFEGDAGWLSAARLADNALRKVKEALAQLEADTGSRLLAVELVHEVLHLHARGATAPVIQNAYIAAALGNDITRAKLRRIVYPATPLSAEARTKQRKSFDARLNAYWKQVARVVDAVGLDALSRYYSVAGVVVARIEAMKNG